MKLPRPAGRLIRARPRHERGGVLVTALLLAIVIGAGLVGYLRLSRTSLSLAQRGFFANDARNLAEAGLEEGIYHLNLLAAGTAPATVWSNWTISGANAMRTLPPFNRDQRAVGIVRLHVQGHDGNAPIVHSQAVVTPFDGSAPVVKTLRISLTFVRGVAAHGLVAISGLNLKGRTIADSFNSNPTGSATGPWRPYSSAIARARTSVVVQSGAISIGSGKIYGDVYLGPGVASPGATEVTGSVVTNYRADFPMPPYPTPASVSQSYSVDSALPPTLPVAGHLPAADGRYYYFCRNTTIGTVTIAAGRDVTIVGTSTSLGPGLTIAAGGSCFIYMDGSVNLSKGTDLNHSGWAGALQIFTTTRGECTMSNNSQIAACLYAPYATLTAQGGSSAGMLMGYYVANTISTSGSMDFHYDESFRSTAAGTGTWSVTEWRELQSAADRDAARTATSHFLH